MKKYIFLISLSTYFCSACYGGKAPGILVGDWLLQGTVNQSSMVECPDLLSLKKDGSYLVSNDCYGLDMKDPVTEEGEWIFDDRNKNLILEGRTFKGNYFLGGDSSGQLSIKVVRSSEDELILQFHSGGQEIYKNIK